MSYDSSSPPVYFSIGQAVAVIAILLAFIQLATPTWKLRWKLGRFKWETACYLFSLGFASVFIAALLPVLFGQPGSYTGYPVFWEMLAGIFFVLGSLGLIIRGKYPVKFTRRNCRQFFNLCCSIIARGDERELGALADEIADSAKNVIGFAIKYNRFQAEFAKREGKSYSFSEPTSWACDILDLWSDRRFCNIIVTRCPGTATAYLCEIQKREMYHSGGFLFVQQLIAEAFRDSDSILHREEQYWGLGHVRAFTETAFGNYNFVSSDFRPLEAAGFSYDNLRNLEKHSECLLRAVKSYLEAKRNHGSISAIWGGVDALVHSANKFSLRIGQGSRPPNIEDDPIWALGRVSRTFKDLVALVKKHDQNLPAYPFDPTNYDQHNDKSIYGVFSKGIYDFFECLASVEGHDWDMRQVAIEIWTDVYAITAGEESKTILEIQKRLEVHLWRQVNTNLEEKHLCYPMIARLLISLIGFYKYPDASDGQKRVSAEFLNLLKKKFRNASLMNEKRVSKLLPEGYEYDKVKNIIIERNRWGGEARTLKCD